jgi:MYXO-CTERM domain-containing protein
MTVNGTVVTAPEPAAMSLAGLGSLGLLARRRRATA